MGRFPTGLAVALAMLVGGPGGCTGGSTAAERTESPERSEAAWRPLFDLPGEPSGELTTASDWDNYHLRVEFRRRRRSSPLPSGPSSGRSGIAYHLVDGAAVGEGAPQGLELRLDRAGCGDFVGGVNVLAEVEGVRQDAAAGRGPIVYRRNEARFTIGLGTAFGNRTVRSEEAERPAGEWNLLEVIAVGRTSVHVVNGRPVMVLANLRRRVAGKEVPLTRGKVRLVSLDPDVLFRDPQIRFVDEIPARFLP